MIVSLEVVNADKVLSKLDALKTGDYSAAITKGCLLIENDAKINCPVGDTGLLRSSITHNVDGNTGEVGTNVEYAPYVEYGTGLFAENGDGRKDVPWFYKDNKGIWHFSSGQHPNPFLRPAFNSNRLKIVDLIKNRVEEILKNG